MPSFDNKATELSNELKARISLAKDFGKAGRQLKQYFKDNPPPKGLKAKALSKRK